MSVQHGVTMRSCSHGCHDVGSVDLHPSLCLPAWRWMRLHPPVYGNMSLIDLELWETASAVGQGQLAECGHSVKCEFFKEIC